MYSKEKAAEAQKPKRYDKIQTAMFENESSACVIARSQKRDESAPFTARVIHAMNQPIAALPKLVHNFNDLLSLYNPTLLPRNPGLIDLIACPNAHSQDNLHRQASCPTHLFQHIKLPSGDIHDKEMGDARFDDIRPFRTLAFPTYMDEVTGNLVVQLAHHDSATAPR